MAPPQSNTLILVSAYANDFEIVSVNDNWSKNLSYLYLDDIEVSVEGLSAQLNASGDIVAELGTGNAGIWTGVTGGFSAISDTDSYIYDTDTCATVYGCVLVYDTDRYNGFIQVTNVKSNSSVENIDEGVDTKYTTYRLVASVSLFGETSTGATSGSSSSSSSPSVPNTGLFAGSTDYLIVITTVSAAAAFAIVFYLLKYSGSRLVKHTKVKFKK